MPGCAQTGYWKYHCQSCLVGKEVDEQEFQKMAAGVCVDAHILQWNFKETDKEFFTFLKRHLSGKAKKAFASTPHAGLDGCRLEVGEVEPINA